MVMEEQETDMELASESIPVPQVQEPQLDPIKRPKRSNRSNQPRTRKKLLYASIRKLMEFYFSDANLSKDRYLSALIKENPYVDISTFMKFNKLNQLTTDPNRIARALRDSTMLKLSEDGTKVCRITPIKKKEDEDQCTVYVQNLPPDTDHDWLISLFSKYGPVEYVSIPRYKYNRAIKGFAFVEFDTSSSAQECIKHFQKKGRVLPSHTTPTDLLSITTFDDNQKDDQKDDVEASMETDDKNSKKNLKRRKSLLEKSSCVQDESGIKLKKKRKEITEQDTVNQHNETENPLKIQTEDDECDNSITGDSNTENQNISDEKVDTNKKNFKKKKHSKSVEESDVKNTETCNIENLRKKGHASKSRDVKDNIENTIVESQDTSEEKTDTVDNSLRERKRKHSPENTEESDVKDDISTNCTTENQEICEKNPDTIDSVKYPLKKYRSSRSTDENKIKNNTENQDISEKKTNIVDNSLEERKRKLCLENTEKSDVKDNITENCNTESQDVCKKSPDTVDSGKSSRKKKRLSKSLDETEFKDNSSENIENCNIENEESPNKNRAKSGEKKKKRVSINNSIETNIGETLKKDSHGRHSKTSSDMEEKEIKVDSKKQKKKRKKKNKSEEDDICNLLGLQVMAKPDWKRLRNKYLDLQRSKMSLLKQHLRKTEMERGEIMTKKKWNNDKTEQDHDRLKEEKNNEMEVTNIEEPSYGRVVYAPGIIVKIEMDEPCTDPQRFKVELKDNNSIQYIDITENSCEAYVRCDTPEAAQFLVKKNYEGKRLSILKDDEEKAYWDKIAQDRKDKLSNKRRVKQRGRQKLLKKAERQLGKCIKFDQD